MFSSSEDATNYGPVSDLLYRRGHDVITIRSDAILRGEQHFLAETCGDTWRVQCDDKSFDPGQVAAAWWRKPQWVHVEREDRLRAASLERELERTHLAIASLIPDSAWLNPPDAIRRAESKLRQLQVAAAFGLQVPPTLLTNDWRAVRSLSTHGHVVYKTLRGSLETYAENYVVFSNRLDHSALSSLEETAHPWPGVFQRFISACREWRVTIVGDTLFSAAIYTEGDAQIDWRKHQFSGMVRFVHEAVPRDIGSACIELVKAFGLRYAAIDLVEREDGSIVFLEMNPNGQYGWLEMQLGLPISEHIATALFAIGEAG